MKKALSVVMFLLLLVAGSSLSAESLYHSADYKPADNKIGFAELLRVIQFYNSGSYHCDSTGEDGYAPGDGDKTCKSHDSDCDPQDWSLGFGELLRMIQFYNSAGYHADSGGKDGFAAGPAPVYVGDGTVYPMFADENNNGINDYTEEVTHVSGSGFRASSVSARSDSSDHGSADPNPGNMDSIRHGIGLYNHSFTDLNGDGICDYAQNGSNTWHGPGFTDDNRNGVCDYWDADSPLYNHHEGLYFQDRNGNVINDYCEIQWHDGHNHNFTDLNGDGVCDYAQDGSDIWHGPNFLDADYDGVCDLWQSGGKGHGGSHHNP